MYADSSRRQNKRVGTTLWWNLCKGKLAGVWGGGNALPRKFSILSLKMATFSAFWALAHVSRGAWPLPAPLGSASEGGRRARNDCRRLTAVVDSINSWLLVAGWVLARVTVADVTATVLDLPDKQSAGDPMPTSLLKSCIDSWHSSCRVQLLNRSLARYRLCLTQPTCERVRTRGTVSKI